MPKWLSTIRARLSSGDRAPLVLFGVLELVAVPLLLWFGRGGWFAFDDWDLLAQRTGGNLGDLFRPHYEHWLTLPILVYRVLWQLFGVRTYVPYQLLSIFVHLIAAALLLVVMRRAGVSAWLSTIFASVFLFFGSGAYNVLISFQITFVGSLVFGLTHLMLADHDGPIDRRDWLGLLAGLAGMLCSGIAVTMVIVVGLAALLRRGLRIAVFHTAPFGVAYLVWLAIIGRHTQHAPFEHPSIGEVVRFVVVGLRATFGGLGQVPGAGLALALVLLTGLAIAFVQLGRDSFRQRAAAPIALLGGAVISLAITGTRRAGQYTIPFGIGGPEYARQGRYVYLTAAMMLPALAFASAAIARRWQPLTAVVLILPILGVPGNLQKFADFGRGYKTRFDKAAILLAPRLPLVAQLPRSIEPDRLRAEGLTLGWLIDGVRSGRVPPPRPVASRDVATETLRLALVRTDAVRVAPCAVLPGPVVRVLHRGQSITLKTATATLVYLPPASAPSRPIIFRGSKSLTLLAQAGPLRLRVIVPAGVVSCG